VALTLRTAALTVACVVAPWRGMQAQNDTNVVVRNDSVSARLVNVDLRLAIQALARYLDRPVVFGNIGEVRVTLETPQPVPRAQLPDLLRGLLKTYGLMLAEQAGFFSVEPIAQAVPQGQSQAAAGPVQLFVIHIRHARAADVAATVNALYGRSGALGETGGGLRPTLSQGLRENLVPPAGAPQPPQQQQPLTTQAAELSGDVTIIPDARTNSLLVRASRADFDLIRAAVEQLDVRPLQVLIQVIIAEVRRDRSLSYGLEALLPPTEIKGSNAQVSGSTRGLGASDFVLKVMHLGGADMTATLTAAASRGDVTILSRPVVLAANNESAEILVGSQRPFIQVQRALPTDNGVRDQVVQFKDVGTRLTVRPTISDDGYVTLRVAQEVNAATAEVAFDAPVISTRTIETQLLVRDGQTAVLGGLTDRQREETRAGVPILSSLPLVGGLFGRLVKRTTETELFVFLSPRVIRNDDDLQNVSESVGNQTKELRREAIKRSTTPQPEEH
jgi:general secretion pathway protein D